MTATTHPLSWHRTLSDRPVRTNQLRRLCTHRLPMAYWPQRQGDPPRRLGLFLQARSMQPSFRARRSLRHSWVDRCIDIVLEVGNPGRSSLSDSALPTIWWLALTLYYFESIPRAALSHVSYRRPRGWHRSLVWGVHGVGDALRDTITDRPGHGCVVGYRTLLLVTST